MNLFRTIQKAHEAGTLGLLALLGCLLSILVIVPICRHHDNSKIERCVRHLRSFLEQPGNRERFIDYLVKSKYWAVRPEYGRPCATRRNDILASHSFIEEQYHVYFHRYGELPYKSPVNENQDCDCERRLSITRSYKNLGFVTIWIKADIGGDLGLAITETKRWFRPSSALRVLANMTEKLALQNLEETLYNEGSIMENMGNGNIHDLAGFEIEHDHILQGSVRGWINCGEPGCVKVLCFDAISGKLLNEKKSERTREYVGWDEERTRKFYFGSDFCVDGDGELRPAKVNVVFTPHGSTNSRLVFSTNTMIRTWIR